jgi:hypothetical protein
MSIAEVVMAKFPTIATANRDWLGRVQIDSTNALLVVVVSAWRGPVVAALGLVLSNEMDDAAVGCAEWST